VGRSDIAIVIPAFNESKTIHEVILDFESYGDVLVVDDGSTDNTKKIVEATDATLISHQFNLGYEAAISTGMKFAVDNNYDYIITTDADGELTHLAIQNFIDLLEQGNLLVTGQRNKKNRLMESIFGSLTFVSFRISDPLCGMKGYSACLCKKYKNFDTNKMIGTELLAYSIRDKIKIRQVPIRVNKRKGESRYGGIFSSFLRIARVMFIFFCITLKKKDI